MGEKIFYQKAPYVLAAAGLIFAATGFTADRYFHSQNIEPGWMLWPVIAAVTSFAGFVIGGLLQKMEKTSTEDPLTGLYNRRYFYAILEYELSRQPRTGLPLCLAMIDVDNFKAVNDKYGHQTGDTVLQEIARIFRENSLPGHTVSRWGGDEFAVLFPETNINHAVQASEQIRLAVEKADALYGSTVSIGVIGAEKGMPLERLLAMADQAMYEAKEGKNTVLLLGITH